MVSHPNSNCLNSIDSWRSNHSNTINHSNSSLPPPYQIRLINPPLPLHKRSSTILRLTKHRYPSRLLCLNNRSIRQLHLLPRAHTTVLFHSDHHRSLRHSHRGPNHRQWQCINLKLLMPHQHRHHQQGSMVLKGSLRYRSLTQQVHSILEHLILGPLPQGPQVWALIRPLLWRLLHQARHQQVSYCKTLLFYDNCSISFFRS